MIARLTEFRRRPRPGGVIVSTTARATHTNTIEETELSVYDDRRPIVALRQG
jgi:hypothetical protein